MGRVSCKRDRIQRSFRKDRIQRLDDVIIDLTCLRVDLPSLSSFGVLEVLRRVQSDLNYVMEGFRMLGKGEVGIDCVSGIQEEDKRADCEALPLLPLSKT